MPNTISLDQLEARAAAFHSDEAARNAPKPTAIRAVFALTTALTDVINLDPESWHDVRRILVEELASVNEQAERHHDDWLAR